jgi:hypothetical protein
MELTHALSPVIPVFLVIGTGYVFGSWKTIDLTSLRHLQISNDQPEGEGVVRSDMKVLITMIEAANSGS